MKVLVTGSNGFIARNLINELKKDDRYEKIYCVNRNIGYLSCSSSHNKVSDIYGNLAVEAWVQSIVRWTKPDIIFHLAAQQGKTIEAYNANVAMTSNLLH